ncbi:hypothetical protein [Enterobacter hormaechei]|uniref:hypothetical protein n=1 Tax=Enterobacter hormaechei TaxID=158836 RepID=UPI0026F244CC|nr:hypothetical protein [Enterobacter hormaechei]
MSVKRISLFVISLFLLIHALCLHFMSSYGQWLDGGSIKTLAEFMKNPVPFMGMAFVGFFLSLTTF